MASLLRTLATCLTVCTLTFLTLRLVPGDPIDLMLGENALATQREQLRESLGLQLPLLKQYTHYLSGLLHADLGNSLTLRKPVSQLIAERAPYTALLAISATLLATLLGIPLGVAAAYKPRSLLARANVALSALFSALPSFWLGPALVLAFSLHWPWLPVVGFDQWSGLILPTFTLGVGMIAVVSRTTETAMAQCLTADYIRTAVAKGASSSAVLFKHAFPNAATAVITIIGLQLGHLLAGAIVTEAIFAWPGLGSLSFDAIAQRDYPTVQGTVLVLALSYVTINALTDRLKAKAITP